MAGLLAIEGLHAPDGKPGNVDTLFAAGFRMMGLMHFFDNEVGSSVHGVSHTGVAATCAGPRNLTDDQLRAIAAKGGLIGIGYFEGAVCGLGAPAIVRAILHAMRIAGIAHVALGSDFDGAVTVPWDTRGVPRITEELLRAGMSREYIRAVMGGNARAFLLQNLPASRK